MTRERMMRWALYLGLTGAAGAVLFLFMYWNESMRVPLWLEGPVRAVYNFFYVFVMPLRTLADGLVHRKDHNLPGAVRMAAYITSVPLMVFLAGLIVRARMERHARHVEQHGKMTRRLFLAHTADAVVLGGGAITGAYATWYEPWRLQVRRYEMPIKGLPAAMDGYTFVQLSDTHYGPFVPLQHIENAIAIANDLKPDFTVLTGDYVLRSPRAIELGVGVMEKVRAKHGVVAVLGNHDHWENADECRRCFGTINIPMLDNARIFLTADGIAAEVKPGTGLCLGGVGDQWTDAVDLNRALGGVDPDVPRIVLSHNPDVAEDRGNPERIDLMLSGHTHGGQISVPYRGAILVPSAYGNKYAGGLCRGPRYPVIVSRGVGMTVLPYRFRVAPEIVHVTLRQMRA